MDRYFRNDADQKYQTSSSQLPGIGISVNADPFSPPDIHPHHFRLRSSYVHPE